MKNTLIICSLTVISTLNVLAQQQVKLEDGSNAPYFYYNNGNVSVGTRDANVNFLTIKGITNDNKYSGIILQSNWNNTGLNKQAGQIVFQAADSDTGDTQETFATINARTTKWTNRSDIGGYLTFSTKSDNSLVERMRISPNGTISLGTTESNVNFLTLKGTDNDNSYSGIVIQSNWNNTALDKRAGQIVFQATDNDSGGTQETFATINARTTEWTSNSDIGGYLTFSTKHNNSITEHMRITPDGDIGIGVTNPDAKLTIKGDIHTHEVKVDLLGAIAPDYVFHENYKLQSLEEIDRYVKNNKHLPNIPSAIEMQQNGIELKEMNLKLLQKVEELTLYLIEQNHRIKSLEFKIQDLEK